MEFFLQVNSLCCTLRAFNFSFHINVRVSPGAASQHFTGSLETRWSFCAVWPELCLTWATPLRRTDARVLSESAGAGGQVLCLRCSRS